MAATRSLNVGDCSAASAIAPVSSGWVPRTLDESPAWASAGPTQTAAITRKPSHFPIAAPLRRGRPQSAPDEDAETGGEMRQRVRALASGLESRASRGAQRWQWPRGTRPLTAQE